MFEGALHNCEEDAAASFRQLFGGYTFTAYAVVSADSRREFSCDFAASVILGLDFFGGKLYD